MQAQPSGQRLLPTTYPSVAPGLLPTPVSPASRHPSPPAHPSSSPFLPAPRPTPKSPPARGSLLGPVSQPDIDVADPERRLFPTSSLAPPQPGDRAGGCTWVSRGGLGQLEEGAGSGGSGRPPGVGHCAAAAPPLIEPVGVPQLGPGGGGGAKRRGRGQAGRSRRESIPPSTLRWDIVAAASPGGCPQGCIVLWGKNDRFPRRPGVRGGRSGKAEATLGKSLRRADETFRRKPRRPRRWRARSPRLASDRLGIFWRDTFVIPRLWNQN